MSIRPIRFSIDSAWSAWHDNKDAAAREWLVVHYASLVKFVAGRLAAGLPRSVDTADLVSAGVFGLMNAIDKFDPSQGAKFETYSIPRIRGAILDGLRALDWVPRSVRAHSQQIQNAIRELEVTLGRVPHDEDIAGHLAISIDEFHSWLSDIAAGSVGPLDHVALEASPASGTNETQPGRALEEDELRATMRGEIRQLPERDRTVLVLYYDEGLTLSEIGEVMGLTESRISQIHTKAVLQLRSRLQAAGMS